MRKAVAACMSDISLPWLPVLVPAEVDGERDVPAGSAAALACQHGQRGYDACAVAPVAK